MGLKIRVRGINLYHKLKGIFTGVNWDGLAYDMWSFRKGEQFDYTHARLMFAYADQREDDGWALPNFQIKPEGASIPQEQWKWQGAIKLGDWWSIQFKLRRLVIRFRYRSWTSNIFYIAWN